MMNVGTADKWIRIIVGLSLLSLFFILHGSAKYFGLIGIVPLATALLGFCPLYTTFGIKTCGQCKK